MNKKIEELYNKIDGLNNIIDLQTLEISQLKEQKKQAIEYIKEHKEHEYRNGNDNEYYLELNENKMNELLEILGEKE